MLTKYFEDQPGVEEHKGHREGHDEGVQVQPTDALIAHGQLANFVNHNSIRYGEHEHADIELAIPSYKPYPRTEQESDNR